MKSRIFVSDWFTCTFDWSLGCGVLSIKRCIIEKKPDIVALVAQELDEFSGKKVVKRVMKERIEFSIPCHEVVGHDAFYEYSNKLRLHMANAVATKWTNMVVFEKGTLQALLMASLKNPGYKLESSVHYAAKHGAKCTLDLLDTIDREWSLRY